LERSCKKYKKIVFVNISENGQTLDGWIFLWRNTTEKKMVLSLLFMIAHKINWTFCNTGPLGTTYASFTVCCPEEVINLLPDQFERPKSIFLLLFAEPEWLSKNSNVCFIHNLVAGIFIKISANYFFSLKISVVCKSTNQPTCHPPPNLEANANI
jgi:hypothetical protein